MSRHAPGKTWDERLCEKQNASLTEPTTCEDTFRMKLTANRAPLSPGPHHREGMGMVSQVVNHKITRSGEALGNMQAQLASSQSHLSKHPQ